MNSKLIELIESNPDLPIYAWVDCDVVQDEYNTWLGKINGNGEIREYVELDYSYSHTVDREWLFKDDTEDWEEYILNNFMENGFSEEEAEKNMQEMLTNIKWEKGIFINVGTL